ncbi:hypothetical protein [Enterovibrio norvegicus]|uniref:Uncharacterized protein n=1 Tax=Enterovibrio norvegicus TaxID=188144 RepID=A0ABV4KYK9_9GAMM|nr:hypothetical protein [Enterovibrio norvegicus]
MPLNDLAGIEVISVPAHLFLVALVFVDLVLANLVFVDLVLANLVLANHDEKAV